MSEIYSWIQVEYKKNWLPFDKRMVSEDGLVVRQNVKLHFYRHNPTGVSKLIKYDRDYVEFILRRLLHPYLDAGLTKHQLLQLIIEALRIPIDSDE